MGLSAPLPRGLTVTIAIVRTRRREPQGDEEKMGSFSDDQGSLSAMTMGSFSDDHGGLSAMTKGVI